MFALQAVGLKRVSAPSCLAPPPPQPVPFGWSGSHGWESWTAGNADVGAVVSTTRPGSRQVTRNMVAAVALSRDLNGGGWRPQLWGRRCKRPQEACMNAHEMQLPLLPQTYLPPGLQPPPWQAALACSPGRTPGTQQVGAQQVPACQQVLSAVGMAESLCCEKSVAGAKKQENFP